MAGTIGIATIYPEHIGQANINQAIAKINLDSNVNKKYIEKILNSSFCKIQVQQLTTTAAQPNINFTQIKSIKIPLPPKEIQNKIVNEIENRREKAEKLQQEALNGLGTAKNQVEEMILREKN